MHIKRDEQVIVISGEYRGKRGRVLKVFQDRNRVVVEGVNFIHRHMRPSQKMQQGGIVKKEAPIHVSNVMVVCPKCDTPTRAAYKVLGDEGKSSRRKAKVCKHCDEMIQVSG